MKVVLRTPTQLVIHDGALGSAFMGALFIAVGGGAITLWIKDPSGWSGNAGPWLIYVVGGLFALIGTLVLSLSADRRYVIDRTAGTARIIEQHLIHRRTSEYRLSEFQDLALEHSRSLSGQGEYFRIVFLTKADTRIPWTPYSTNDEGHQAACVSAVRTFMGWSGHEAVAPPTPNAVASAGAVSGHPLATNWGCLAAFLSIFVAIGLGVFGAEVLRVATWTPVSARVLSTDIKMVRGNKGNSYTPMVQYQYTYDGTLYSSSRVLPVTMSAGLTWAERIRDRFQPGAVVTAYVNPRAPSNSFLVREVSLIPLIFVVFPIAMAALFGWIVRTQRRQLETVAQYPVPIVEA